MHASAAAHKPHVGGRLSALANAAAAWLEVPDLARAHAAGEQVAALAEAHRMTLYAAKAAFVLRSVAYRSGRSVQVVDAPSVLETSGASAGVHSFRALDVMRGGQGAPLAPMFHAAIAVQAAAEGRPGVRLPLAVVNLGGVANITYVGARAAELVAGSASDASHGGAGDSLVGFDCGPGMALLDDELRAAACSLTGAASSSSSSSGSLPRFDEGG